MAKLNISIDDDLRSLMKSLDRQPNWSGIAAAAFRQYMAAIKTDRKTSDMNIVIERLKAAQELETAQNSELGRQEGREWARKSANPRQLKRLAAARDQVNDWYIGQGSSAYSCGDLIAAVLDGTTDSPVRRAFENMVSAEFADLDDDPEFVQGFAEGCMEVWYEVQDKL